MGVIDLGNQDITRQTAQGQVNGDHEQQIRGADMRAHSNLGQRQKSDVYRRQWRALVNFKLIELFADSWKIKYVLNYTLKCLPCPREIPLA
jgi:hypothetical protein